MGHINKIINDIIVEKFNDNNSKFAEFMGTTEANIRNYRNNTEPKLQFIMNLSEKLEISYDALFGRNRMSKPASYETANIVGKNNSSNVIGSNVNGSGININATSTELLDIIKKQQEQMDKLIDIINKTK